MRILKRMNLTVGVLFVLIFTQVPNTFAYAEFISVWDTSKTSYGSSDSNQVALPLEFTGTYDFEVDWGDGEISFITSYNQAETTHTYPSEGIYEIIITGQITGFRFNNTGDKAKIIEIKDWGSLNVGNNGNYFYGCYNLDVSAAEPLNLEGTANLSGMFRNAFAFNGDINNWDTSQVTDMKYMFYRASSFNQTLDNWDTSKVKDMQYISYRPSSFRQLLNNENPEIDMSMKYIFYRPSSFTQLLNSANVPKAAYRKDNAGRQ